jgi:hypothetical protein
MQKRRWDEEELCMRGAEYFYFRIGEAFPHKQCKHSVSLPFGVKGIFGYRRAPPRSLWTDRLPLPATQYVLLRCRAKMIPIETTLRNLCQPPLAEDVLPST